MYQAVEFTDVRPSVENLNPAPIERPLGTFETEFQAIEAGREARFDYHASGRDDYVWWIVRQPGAKLAQWIADSRNDKEFVLDISSGQLVEIA